MKNDLMLCKACGTTMAKNAKSCPKCGAKNKKPFYKRFWFWLVVVLVLLMASCSTSTGGSNNTVTDTKSETASSSAVTSTTTEEAVNEPQATEEPAEPEEEEQPAEESPASMSEKNALRKAGQYLDIMSFSYTGLIKQLEYDGFSTEDATYAADNCGADWNEQAAKKAEQYLDLMAFSRDGLIKPLEYDGFTLLRAAACKHHVHGLEQNLDIAPQGPVIDILDVQTDDLLKILDVAAAADLPQAGNAWLHG